MSIDPKVKWYQISIMPTSNGKKSLILICENKDIADKLKAFIVNNYFELHLSLTPAKEFNIVLSFPQLDFHFNYPTGKTKESYPPLAELAKGNVPYITTGIEETPNFYRWDDNYHLLEFPRMN